MRRAREALLEGRLGRLQRHADPAEAQGRAPAQAARQGIGLIAATSSAHDIAVTNSPAFSPDPSPDPSPVDPVTSHEAPGPVLFRARLQRGLSLDTFSSARAVPPASPALR